MGSWDERPFGILQGDKLFSLFRCFRRRRLRTRPPGAAGALGPGSAACRASRIGPRDLVEVGRPFQGRFLYFGGIREVEAADASLVHYPQLGPAVHPGGGPGGVAVGEPDLVGLRWGSPGVGENSRWALFTMRSPAGRRVTTSVALPPSLYWPGLFAVAGLLGGVGVGGRTRNLVGPDFRSPLNAVRSGRRGAAGPCLHRVVRPRRRRSRPAPRPSAWCRTGPASRGRAGGCARRPPPAAAGHGPAAPQTNAGHQPGGPRPRPAAVPVAQRHRVGRERHVVPRLGVDPRADPNVPAGRRPAVSSFRSPTPMPAAASNSTNSPGQSRNVSSRLSVVHSVASI